MHQLSMLPGVSPKLQAHWAARAGLWPLVFTSLTLLVLQTVYTGCLRKGVGLVVLRADGTQGTAAAPWEALSGSSFVFV